MITKRTAGMLLPLLAMSFGESNGILFDSPSGSKLIFPEVKAPIPKGAKEYFFNEQGYCSTAKERDWCAVFTCIALNEENARRKYYKWKNKNQII